MRDRWDANAFEQAVARWGAAGQALAERTYSARLIGADPALVLHGGGNTSVKAPFVDVLGDRIEALWIKGSGWDLGAIEPAGHPPVALDYLRRLRSLERLSDEDMVDAVRSRMLAPRGPTPSVETLLHAFLPHRFIDHSHADAIVALTNHPDGPARVAAALGDDVAIVPYVKAGFDLAKVAADVHDAHPGCQGLVLLQHGLFTFGDSARESYARHIALVGRAEAWLAREARVLAPASDEAVAAARRAALAVAPALRRALGAGRTGETSRWILDYRCTPGLLALADAPALREWASRGPLTPDHVIRTKSRPLVARSDELEAEVAKYRAWYNGYFEACASAAGGVAAYRRLDDTPCVAWVPGVGLFGIGPDRQAAAIAADIAERTLATVARTPGFTGLSDARLFEMEYWSLEQAKLGGKAEPALARRVALVTGGAGAIGVGVSRQLLAAGAHVVLTDRDGDALARAAEALRGGARLRTAVLDVTDERSVADGFDAATAAFGGVDVVVVNAGIARTATLATCSLEDFRAVEAVNLDGAFLTLREAARRLTAQGTGGHIVVVSSKNVLAPGEAFGAYSASKAGAHQLAKVAALELAAHGIRVNLVAPDAVFAEGDVPSGLWAQVGPERARVRGVDPAALPAWYRGRSLLGVEVTGRHVGNAVVFFASEATPTTGATLPVDAGVAAAFPR